MLDKGITEALSKGIKKITTEHCVHKLKYNESENDVEPLVKAIKEAHDFINNEDDGDLINVTQKRA